ncbi:hypothetical protein CWI37_1764p0020 [Hamiltosporidium tvaerminnensis]|uniref:Uncharacterized protein n=1 Tax=Hamiltosporidium tvaerminnensis TaxID=1176355 RepID=A0A4Q9KUG3_9MICR|nr:hypothetical protein CWI37_1764p0020 [Hamiltosporidium tvaerminnensis]
MKVKLQNYFLMIAPRFHAVYLFALIFWVEALKLEKQIILHFYTEIHEVEANTERHNEFETSFSKLVKRKYNCYRHKECMECTKLVIRDCDMSPLTFKLEGEEIADRIIFINTNILTYNEFRYFLKSLQAFNDCKENFRIDDCVLIIHILDVFKFKKDKIFHQFIRIVLVSTIYNNRCYCTNSKVLKSITPSSSICKSILYEFCSIYFFDVNSIFGKTSPQLIKKIIKDNFDKDFCSKKQFVQITSKFLVEIDRQMQYNREFKIGLRIFFLLFRPLRMVSYCGENNNHILNSFLFKPYTSTSELCFWAWKDMELLKRTFQNLAFKNVKTLFFFYCQFTSFKENYFKNFTCLRDIYLFHSYGEYKVFSDKSYTFIKNLVSLFYMEIIEDQKLTSRFLKITNNNKPINFAPINMHSIDSTNKIFISQEEFDSENYQIYLSDTITISFSNIEFKVNILDRSKIRKIEMYIYNVYVDRIYFESLYISKNLKGFQIHRAKLSSKFLSEVLLLSNLETIVVTDSTITFPKHTTNYHKHLLMNELSIIGCVLENQDRIFEFINSMPKLKNLTLLSNIDTYFFIKIFENNMIKLSLLEKFHFSEEGTCDSGFLDFLNNDSIIDLNVSFRSKGGSLSELFGNEKMLNIEKLQLEYFKIGFKDRKSIVNYKKMHYLHIFECDFYQISFSELFDKNEECAIEILTSINITIRKCDIIFLSRLRKLRSLSIQTKYRFFDYVDLFRFVRFYSSKLNIEIGFHQLLWSEKHKFKEIFGNNQHEIYVI